MNLYYAIYGNEAKIIDENENKTTREVTKNFHETLIKENEIEEMENQLEEANKTINEEKEIINHNNSCKKYELLKGLFFGLLSGTCISWVIVLMTMELDVIYFLGIILISALTGGGMCLSKCFEYNKVAKRKLHVAELQTYFLEKEIPLKKQELEELKQNDKKLETPIKQGMEKVDDKKVLIRLRKHLDKLKQYGKTLPELADKYAEGFWGEEDRENVQNDGIDADLFEQYLIEYNTRKLMKGKRAS